MRVDLALRLKPVIELMSRPQAMMLMYEVCRFGDPPMPIERVEIPVAVRKPVIGTTPEVHVRT